MDTFCTTVRFLKISAIRKVKRSFIYTDGLEMHVGVYHRYGLNLAYPTAAMMAAAITADPLASEE
jgi:hypothetical protein